jgi:hypothetical protein
MMASSVPATQGSDPFADRRAFPRVSVALPAFLDAAGERHSVQMLDLSAGGAKLDCPVTLVAGAGVTLDCGTFERPATVRWQEGRFLGLSFESELNDREMMALVGRSDALSAWRVRRD